MASYATVIMISQCTCIAHNTRTHPFNGLFLGLPGSAGTRKVKPIRTLRKQETVSGSGILLQTITTPAPHNLVLYRPDALPAVQAVSVSNALGAISAGVEMSSVSA